MNLPRRIRIFMIYILFSAFADAFAVLPSLGRTRQRKWCSTNQPRRDESRGKLLRNLAPPTTRRSEQSGEYEDMPSVFRSSLQRWIVFGGLATLTSLLLPKPVAAVVTAASLATRAVPVPTENVTLLLSALLLITQSLLFPILRGLVVLGRSGIRLYLKSLQDSPLLTKSITTTIIGVLGDYMAQWFEYTMRQQNQGRDCNRHSNSVDRDWKSAFRIHNTYDVRRGLAIGTEALFLSGPLMHFGYNLMEDVFPVANGGGSIAAFLHVVVDSLVLDSFFVATAFVFTGLFEGYRWRTELWPQFQKDYIPTLKASLVTSTSIMPIEFLCFRFLPVALRTLSVNLLDVLWDAIISFMTHRHRPKRHPQHGERFSGSAVQAGLVTFR